MYTTTELNEYISKLEYYIDKCKKFQREDDPLAKERVATLENSSLVDKKFYVNATLISPIVERTVDIEKRKLHSIGATTKIDPNKFFEGGMMLVIDVQPKAKNISPKIKCMSFLKNYYSNVIMNYMNMKRKGYVFSSFDSVEKIKSEIEHYSNLDNATSIVYCIALFSRSAIQEVAESICDMGYSVESWSLNNMRKPGIATLDCITPTEQDFINWLKTQNVSSSTFESVVKTSMKNTKKNVSLANDFELVDIASFFMSNEQLLDEYEGSHGLYEIELYVNEIPLSLIDIVKTVTFSKCNNIVEARNSLEAAKAQYKGNYCRAVVDTINYDPWEKLISDMENACSKCKNELAMLNEKPTRQIYTEENEPTSFAVKKSLCSKTFTSIPLLYIQQGIYGSDGKAMEYLLLREYMRDYIIPSIPRTIIENDENGKPKKYADYDIDYIEYEDILKTDEWQKRNSIINQFSEDDWYKYKMTYKTAGDGNIFMKDIPIYIYNGRLFYPTGLEVFIDDNTNKFMKDFGMEDYILPEYEEKDIEKRKNSYKVKDFDYKKAITNGTYINSNELLGDGDLSTELSETKDQIIHGWKADKEPYIKEFIANFENREKLKEINPLFANLRDILQGMSQDMKKIIVYPPTQDICYMQSKGCNERYLIYRVEKIECGHPCYIDKRNGICDLKSYLASKEKTTSKFAYEDDLYKQYLYYKHKDMSNEFDVYSEKVSVIENGIRSDNAMLTYIESSLNEFLSELSFVRNDVMKSCNDLLASCNLNMNVITRYLDSLIKEIKEDAFIYLMCLAKTDKMRFADLLQLVLQTYIDSNVSIALFYSLNIDEILQNIEASFAMRLEYLLVDSTRFNEFIDFKTKALKSTASLTKVSEKLVKNIEKLFIRSLILKNIEDFNLKKDKTNDIMALFDIDQAEEIPYYINLVKSAGDEYEEMYIYDNLVTTEKFKTFAQNLSECWKFLRALIEKSLNSSTDNRSFSIISYIDKINGSAYDAINAKKTFDNATQLLSIAQRQFK